MRVDTSKSAALFKRQSVPRQALSCGTGRQWQARKGFCGNSEPAPSRNRWYRQFPMKTNNLHVFLKNCEECC
jgi:hypothetical protein